MPEPEKVRTEIVVHPRTSRGASQMVYLEPLAGESGSDQQPAFAAEAWQAIRQRLPWIIWLVLAGSVAGILLSFIETPTYEAAVSLEIQNPAPNSLSTQIGDLQADGESIAPEAYLPTQAAILQSRSLQERTIQRLEKDSFQPASKKGSSFWSGFLGRRPSAPRVVRLVPPLIKVKIQPETRIVQILCDSSDARFATAYANALANEYIDSELQSRWDSINRSREWLEQQLSGIRSKLQSSEDQLQAYGRSSNLMFTGDKESADQDKLKQIQEALSTAEAERIEKQSAYQIAKSATPDSIPQVLDNARLNEYQAQLADLRRQLAELSSQYTPEHPKVQRIQAQIDQVQSTFNKERDNILTKVRNEYQAAAMRENMLSGAYQQQAQIVADQTQKSVNYGILERDVETNRQLYDALLQKAREADIATAMRGSNARIIDSAQTPDRPVEPNMVWNTLLGTASGLIAGLAFVVVRAGLDRSFKAPGEASQHLQLPELGVIPAGKLLHVSGATRSSVTSRIPLSDAGEYSRPEAVELATWLNKSSTIAESFRGALASVLHSAENGSGPRVIMISSAARAEGKTTIVSNLGIALAEINQRVLLIDADMRKPRLSEVFDVSNDWGLSDLLREKSSLRDCPLEALVKQTEIPNLNILTSGPRTASITNLLYSNRMLELLQRLRCEFDNILIDTPPMLQIADARILGRLVDGAILVFRAGQTSRDAALAAKRRLTEDGIPVLGTILNAWDIKAMNRYGYGENYYYDAQ